MSPPEDSEDGDEWHWGYPDPEETASRLAEGALDDSGLDVEGLSEAADTIESMATVAGEAQVNVSYVNDHCEMIPGVVASDARKAEKRLLVIKQWLRGYSTAVSNMAEYAEDNTEAEDGRP